MGGERYRLDTVATIFPATARKDWRNLFRTVIVLTEPVDPEVLQQSVDDMVKRFPTFFVSLANDAFQFYLQESSERVMVRPDSERPFVVMSDHEARTNCLRVLYRGNRIALEFFHVLTDGMGAIVFLCTLVARYLELKHGIVVPAEGMVRYISQAPSAEEMEDSCLKHGAAVAGKLSDKPSFIPRGKREPGGLAHVTLGVADAEELLDAAHRHGVSLTALLAAAIIFSVMEMQDLKVPKKRQKPVHITVPVDLRRLFNSDTLRNFTMVLNPGIDPRLGTYSFDEICKSLHYQIRIGATRQNMAGKIAAATNLLKSPVFGLTPLFLKNLSIDLVYEFAGEKSGCMNLSNLGVVTLPEAMGPYVERLECILGPLRDVPYNCGVLSYGGKTYINITRTIRETELEERFFTHLRELGVSTDVSCDGIPATLPGLIPKGAS